jgi:Ca2+-transporting ATPase
MRLLVSIDIQVNESTLTGESLPIEKDNEVEKDNLLYTGTTVVSGRGEGIVIKTGMNTVFGKIAKLVSDENKEITPLQKSLDELGKTSGNLSIATAILFFIIGYFFLSKDLIKILTTAVILAVAGVPEGLPTIIAITLAIGMQTMAQKNAIVRRMSVIEDLGLITTICTDKTGTLTTNQMSPKYIYADGNAIDITRVEKRNDSIDQMFISAIIANAASMDEKGQSLGDPTEVGLLIAAAKFGLNVPQIRSEYEFIHENKFDSFRKMMSTVASNGKGKPKMYIKGALEQILTKSDKYYGQNGTQPMDEKKRAKIKQDGQKIAELGMRLIGLARKEITKDYTNEDNLEFLGFIALYDPPRPEVKGALELCNKAGIKVYMITGDAKETALNIATETGFGKINSMAGAEFEGLNEAEQKQTLSGVSIFYRVSPIQKHLIVSRLKQLGEIVAVTGDGVNDAPAMKKSDIGISMGKTGADITKEVSGLILLDDNFATIVTAIEYGRKIYENILNFVRFQFTTTTALLLTNFVALILGLPEPFKAIQMLFINVIMDGPPALAIGLEPANSKVMEKPPRGKDAKYITKNFISVVGFNGLAMTLLMIIFYIALEKYGVSNEKYLSMSFVTMVCFQLFNALNCRSFERNFYEGLSKNKLLIVSLGISFTALIATINVPFLESFMQTTTLTFVETSVCILYASLILIIEQARKKLGIFLDKRDLIGS